MTQRGTSPPDRRPERDAPPESPKTFAGTGRAMGRGSLLAWLFSGAAHGVVFSALFLRLGAPPPPSPPPPILVNLVELPRPAPPGPPDQPPGPPAAAPVKVEAPQKPLKATARRRSAPAPVPAEDAKPLTDTFSDILSDTELAGATSADAAGAGGGGGGGTCDMAQAVQRALRRDPLVHSAVLGADRLGKSIMLWNGDWVQAGVQDGKGLSAVREAVLWEVAFAPESCRNRPVHGLVLLTLADGNTRFAIGSGNWRWGDLLSVHGTPSPRYR